MADVWTIYASLASSIGLVAGGAHWLAQQFINHRLQKEMQEHDARLRREVDEYLGERSADRDYKLDARKRLYTAIGPFRYQLVDACNDFASRVHGISGRHSSYALNLTGYYGASTLHRLVTLLALCELIYRQMTYADFSVDTSVVMLMRFRRAVKRCLSDALVSDDPTDWNTELDHLVKASLVDIALAAIVTAPERPSRTIRFDEFRESLNDGNYTASLRPLPEWIERLNPTAEPLLWARFVAVARVCNELVRLEGPSVGFDFEAFDTATVLRASADAVLNSRHDEYVASIEGIATSIKMPEKDQGNDRIANPISRARSSSNAALD